MERPRAFLRDLGIGLAFPLTTWRRSLFASAVAGLTFVALVLSTFPEMSVQMLSADVGYLDDAVLLLVGNVFETAGATGVALLFAYAVLTGITVTAIATQIRVAGVQSATGLGGVAPGLLAAGCASCGAGVLGLLGFAGALAALPMDGTLLRVGGILLLLFVLGRTGDPRQCSI